VVEKRKTIFFPVDLSDNCANKMEDDPGRIPEEFTFHIK
jgi:hypothetical protein